MIVGCANNDANVRPEVVHQLKFQHKEVQQITPQAKGDHFRDLEAMTPLEVLHESNGDEGTSTGTSTNVTSAAVSSSASSSSSSSSSSLSSSAQNSASVEGNKGGRKGLNLCRQPLWQQTAQGATGARHGRPGSHTSCLAEHRLRPEICSAAASDVDMSTTSRIFKALLISKRRLCFEPSNKLYFPYEPGKQSTSAVRIRNICRSAVAFKFQTTAPKSCFMRPPSGVLSPGESIVASVVKFIELPKALDQGKEVPHKRRTRDKFKIVSLKIHESLEFTPELFEEKRELVAVEQILQVILLDPKKPSTQLEKLKALLVESDAAQEMRNKSQDGRTINLSNISDISVLEEWKQRKLARQQAK